MPSYQDITTEELFDKFAKTRDSEIREVLIERHLYIAEILSKKYVNKGIDYDDIYQVACMGLIFAVDRFDVSKGFKFSSFATPTIVGEIKKYFRDKGWTIRVPRRIQELSKKISIAKGRLYKDLSRTPTVKDLANYLDVSEEEIIETLDASKVYTPTSLDLEYDSNSDDRDVRLMDVVGEEDENIEMIAEKDFIDRMMEQLTPIEQKIIKDRFFDEKTQISVAEELDVSQMTISRMEKKILKRLREEYTKSLNG